MKPAEIVLDQKTQVLRFLRTRYPLYHNSNVFFRDLQYGIKLFLENEGQKIGYAQSEALARDFARALETERIFSPVDAQTWVLNFPEFKKEQVKPAPAASKTPAPSGAPGTKPAAPKAAGSPQQGQGSAQPAKGQEPEADSEAA